MSHSQDVLYASNLHVRSLEKRELTSILRATTLLSDSSAPSSSPSTCEMYEMYERLVLRVTLSLQRPLFQRRVISSLSRRRGMERALAYPVTPRCGLSSAPGNIAVFLDGDWSDFTGGEGSLQRHPSCLPFWLRATEKAETALSWSPSS